MSVGDMSVWSLPIHFPYNISVTFPLEFNSSHGNVPCGVKNVLHNHRLLWYNKLRLGSLSYNDIQTVYEEMQMEKIWEFFENMNELVYVSDVDT